MLDIEQILEGMRIAAQNSNGLLTDAKTLHREGSFSTAVALAILSIEESGKLMLLRGMLSANRHDIKKHWKDFRSHKKKNVLWTAPALASKGARTLDQVNKILREDIDQSEVLESIKQLSLYTDCFNKAKWSNPRNLADSDFASGLIAIAELLAPKDQVERRDLELWQEHVASRWYASHEEMSAALLCWHSAMKAEGLLHADDESMPAFLATSRHTSEPSPASN